MKGAITIINGARRLMLRILLRPGTLSRNGLLMADEVREYVRQYRPYYNFYRPDVFDSALDYWEEVRRQLCIWDKQQWENPEIFGTFWVDTFAVCVPQYAIDKLRQGVQGMLDWATELERVAKGKTGYWDTGLPPWEISLHDILAKERRPQ